MKNKEQTDDSSIDTKEISVPGKRIDELKYFDNIFKFPFSFLMFTGLLLILYANIF
jgi:hypothetical protein